MTRTHVNREADEGADIASGPAEVLADKVIVALVEANLISKDDGDGIHADLAAGRLDAIGWKLVIENQLERKAKTDERK